jgi:serine/threonine protein phosphatase 1
MMNPALLTVREPDRLAVIGDIHGRRDLLARLLAQLGDIPVLVAGDVCDRGPDTRGVLDLLLVRHARGVLGDHDEWFLEWASGDGFDRLALAPTIGGEATLRSYGVVGRGERAVARQSWRVPGSHLAWLRGLAWAADVEVAGVPFWIVHAGVPESVAWQLLDVPRGPRVVPTLAEQRSSALLWSSAEPSEGMFLDRPVIMGHRVVREPIDLGHVVAIDTGCGTVPGGRLTAVVLPERRFVSVP